MGAYKSVNLIVALVWLYFAFMASVFISFPMNNPKVETRSSILLSTSNPKKSFPTLTEGALRGKKIFKANCASCHNKNMSSDMTGPALKGAADRWSEYPADDLRNWIRNSVKLIDAKHPRAIEVAKEWDYDLMTSMEHLSDEDIDDVLAYIEMF